MSKNIAFATAFVTITLLIAYLIKPQTEEMIYIYEKTKNKEELKEQYSKLIKEEPNNIQLEKKYIRNLKGLEDENYLFQSIDFYAREKDKQKGENIAKFYSERKDYANSLYWLEIVYKDFEDINILKKIINLASFTQNQKLQRKYLKKLYNKQATPETLFVLNSLGEKEFTNKNLYSLAMSNNTTSDEYIQIIKHFIYNKDFKTAYKLYSRKSLEQLQVSSNIQSYEYLILNSQKSELQRLYKYMFITTKKEIYLTKLANYYEQKGDIDNYLNLYAKAYKQNSKEKYLEELIKYSFYFGDVDKYIYYLSKQTLKEKNLKNAQYIVNHFLSTKEYKKLNSFLNKLQKITKDYDEFKELTILTMVHLDNKKQAKQLFMKYKPTNPSSKVVYALFKNKINETSMPYFMKILPQTNDEVTKAKLFRYRYKTLRLFTKETYKAFGQPNTYKKLSYYIKAFNKKDQDKIYAKFIKQSNDPMFLTQTANHFLALSEYDKAKKILDKSFMLYDKSLLTLKAYIQLYLAREQLEEAKKYISLYLNIKPNSGYAFFQMAQIHFFSNNIDKANTYYALALENLEGNDIEEKVMILISKARINSINDLTKDFETLITQSNYNEYVITSYINLHLQANNYKKVDTLLKTYEPYIKDKNSLRSIQTAYYIGIKSYDKALALLEIQIQESKNENERITLYEQLGFLYNNMNKNKNAIEAFDEAIALGSNNKVMINYRDELNKTFRNQVFSKIGIQNKVFLAQLGYTHTFDDYKLSLYDEQFKNYNSAKINLEVLNHSVKVGIGKEYTLLSFNNIKNSNISVKYEDNVDYSTEEIIDAELKYKNYSLNYNNTLYSDYYLNLSYDFYEYEDFDRNKLSAFVNYNLGNNYYTGASFVNEEVNEKNNFGYEDFYSMSFLGGKNFIFTDDLNFIAEVGTEFRDEDFSLFSNTNLIYKTKDMDINFENGVGKDNFSDDYTFTSILSLRYYF